MKPSTLSEARERRRRTDSKLTDDQLRVLYRLHIERGRSIRELGRLVWRQAGFASPLAAGRAISRGFARLHLPARSCTESRQLAKQRGYARCEELKANGEHCESFALVGDRLCWPHRYPELARAQAAQASPWVVTQLQPPSSQPERSTAA